MVKLTLLTLAVTLVSTALAAPTSVPSSGDDKYSGVIPGTNITIKNLMDPRTGKPMLYETLVKHMLPGLPPMAADVATLGNGAIHHDKRGEFDEREYLRRWCVPQVSVNPLANPYHEKLVGKKNINYITGAGRPILYPEPGLDCPKNAPAPGCTISISSEITYQNAIAYSVSDSESNSVVKNVGGSSSITRGSSVSETVSHTIEKSWSNTDTHTEESSLSNTVGDIITTGWSQATGNVKINGKDEHGGNSTNTVDENNGNWHAEGSISGSGGVPIFGPQVTVTASGGGGGGWSNSKGSTTDQSTTHSSSNQDSTNHEDNYSKQTQDLTTETTGTSDSHSSTVGGSESDTNSVMNTKSVDVTESKDWSVSTGKETGSEHSNSTTNTIIKSSTATKTFPVAPGDCIKLVCIPQAEMVIVPFLCADTETQTAERTHAALARLQQKNGTFGCFSVGGISCYEAIQDSMPFITYDTVYASIGPKNSLRVGNVLDSSNPLVSNNGDFIATLEADGNFVIWRGTIKVWQTGGTPFKTIPSVTKYKHRMRINSRGHLVRETANMWSKVTPPYIPDTYVTSWSTQPVYNNYTVGSPRRSQSTVDDYVLVLDDFGRLSLYDAAYIKTWCTFDSVGSSCPNNKGFSYQDYYLVPTDIVTPRVYGDVHNDIAPDYNITFISGKNSFVSPDVLCGDGLKSGTGMTSPNGRFKLILDNNGDLLLKDDYRTMWESFTGNMVNATGPYRLLVTDQGDMAISDSNQHWIWYAENKKTRNAGPYKASVTDAGKLVVTSSTGEEVWESWPQRGMNVAFGSYNNLRFCYAPCGECEPVIAPTKTITTTTVATPTFVPMPNADSISTMCNNLMKDYNVQPFMNWGLMENNQEMQSKWQFYDCTCFGASSKYGIGIFDGNWGTLKDSAIQQQFSESACNCPVAQDKYKVLPEPKNWGSMTDVNMRNGWVNANCDESVNREPFVHNPVGGPSVTLTSVTTNTIQATISGTIYPTVAITTAYTVVPATATIPPYVPPVTPTPTSTTTKTTTTVKPTSTPTKCSGGSPGKGLGNGTTGQCCIRSADCKENCKNNMCGVCGKDFVC